MKKKDCLVPKASREIESSSEAAWAYGPHFHRGISRFLLPLYALGWPPPVQTIPDVDGLSRKIKLLKI